MGVLGAQVMWGGFSAPIWLSLDPFIRLWGFDFGGAGSGLIWAKLKSDFTNKNLNEGPEWGGLEGSLKMKKWRYGS